VQPKDALNVNKQAEAMLADRATLFIILVLTGSHTGSGPSL